ncbi:MAG: hypothetical protein U0527_14205 [Candidatus Eisenbacteria bacterium]
MSQGRSQARRTSLALAVGIGFLMLFPPVARAGAIEEASQCLEAQARAEAERDRSLTAADSLGARIADAGDGVPSSLLREAEAMQRRAMDRELDLLVQKDRCRKLATSAVAELDRRIERLEAGVELRGAAAGAMGELLEAKRLRAGFAAALESPPLLSYADLEPDSSDTQETLAAKLQYYRDVSDYLRGVGQRLTRRVSELESERRVLEETSRFLRDLSFLDEGGRVSADGSVRLRGGAGGGDSPGGGQERPSLEFPTDGRSASLEFALRATPTSSEESERIEVLLTRYQREIERELGRIAERTQRIEARILPGSIAPR